MRVVSRGKYIISAPDAGYVVAEVDPYGIIVVLGSTRTALLSSTTSTRFVGWIACCVDGDGGVG